ncbi:hypothetical protein G5V59_17550 [Nocardioides sp. W3-2-3]|nr:hypothetical protein [Nocardioides convexus]
MATTTKPERQRSWITDLLSLGVWLALPYLVVGVLWADAHREQTRPGCEASTPRRRGPGR